MKILMYNELVDIIYFRKQLIHYSYYTLFTINFCILYIVYNLVYHILISLIIQITDLLGHFRT